MDVFGTKIPSTDDKKWLDENGPLKDYITSLRLRYNFSWRDQFGENYFQPERKITLGETFYLLATLDSKREYYAINQK
jgi:hypothetical protein